MCVRSYVHVHTYTLALPNTLSHEHYYTVITRYSIQYKLCKKYCYTYSCNYPSSASTFLGSPPMIIKNAYVAWLRTIGLELARMWLHMHTYAFIHIHVHICIHTWLSYNSGIQYLKFAPYSMYIIMMDYVHVYTQIAIHMFIAMVNSSYAFTYVYINNIYDLACENRAYLHTNFTSFFKL